MYSLSNNQYKQMEVHGSKWQQQPPHINQPHRPVQQQQATQLIKTINSKQIYL